VTDGKLRVKVPVKRLHSRHRRYIAPGVDSMKLHFARKAFGHILSFIFGLNVVKKCRPVFMYVSDNNVKFLDFI
jgi:hypothetical protein